MINLTALSDSYNDDIEYIRNELSISETLIQTAEELNELAAIIVKMARIIGTNNVSPMPASEALAKAEEELADVMVCFDVIAPLFDQQNVAKIQKAKMTRWHDRLKAPKTT